MKEGRKGERISWINIVGKNTTYKNEKEKKT
jgi:hypothetical protein